MKLLKMYVNKLISGVSAGALFPQKPMIHFYPEIETCPYCESELHVHKTWGKTKKQRGQTYTFHKNIFFVETGKALNKTEICFVLRCIMTRPLIAESVSGLDMSFVRRKQQGHIPVK